MHISIGPEI